MNAMEEQHLTIETLIDGKRVGIQDINDPFLHNRTYYVPSIWDRLRILFTGHILFEIKIRGDNAAHRQWFRTDALPKGGEGGPQEAL
jgi:hypothetical protein